MFFGVVRGLFLGGSVRFGFVDSFFRGVSLCGFVCLFVCAVSVNVQRVCVLFVCWQPVRELASVVSRN